MVELLFTLLAWVGNNTNYNVDVVLPNIVMTEPYNLCSAYGINDMGRSNTTRLMGFYDKNNTIYLRISFNKANLKDKSRLIHELVHYVQWINGSNLTKCLGELELEAYEIQDRWRLEHGLEPALDEFNRILLGASCDS